MINWLTDYIGTGAYLEVSANKEGFEVIDVRNLVDRDGNTNEAIAEKVQEALKALNQKKKVVVCCDYGMSRSNSIAAGIISKYDAIPFSQAVTLIQQKVSEKGVKLEVLNSVFKALNDTPGEKPGEEERIMITGGSGFIGSRLTARLTNSFFVKSLSGKEVDLIHNPVLLDLLIKENRITTLIHLANPRIYTVNIAMGDSLVMLKNILEVCRLNGVKLIYVSSWEVYSGYKSEELLADESLPLFPRGSYGESKWMAEGLIRHYSALYELKYTILRSSPIYGDHSDKPKFIYNFIDKALKNETIATHRYLNGYPKLDLLYIEDFLSALERAISVGGNETFNIGSGRLISTKQIAEIIVNLLHSESAIESTSIDSYYSNIRMDFGKAKRILGWEPTATFETFVKKLAK